MGHLRQKTKDNHNTDAIIMSARGIKIPYNTALGLAKPSCNLKQAKIVQIKTYYNINKAQLDLSSEVILVLFSILNTATT